MPADVARALPFSESTLHLAERLRFAHGITDPRMSFMPMALEDLAGCPHSPELFPRRVSWSPTSHGNRKA